jgi:hypothetical protein
MITCNRPGRGCCRAPGRSFKACAKQAAKALHAAAEAARWVWAAEARRAGPSMGRVLIGVGEDTAMGLHWQANAANAWPKAWI